MVTQDSRLTINRDGEVFHIQFQERNVLEEAYIQTIGMEIGRLIDESTSPKILINFKNVEHLSSAALGTLITISNRVKEKDGQLKLSNIDPRVHEIFLITKLDKLFQIYKDSEQAAQSFK